MLPYIYYVTCNDLGSSIERGSSILGVVCDHGELLIAPCTCEKILKGVFKVGHSSNFVYQGFAEKYFLSIYQSKAKLKTKKKMGVSVHLSEQ